MDAIIAAAGLVALVAAHSVCGVVAARRLSLPPAGRAVAGVVVALSAATVVAQLLGLVGLLRPIPLVAASVAVAAAAVVAAPRLGSARPAPESPSDDDGDGGSVVVVRALAGACVGGTAALWVVQTWQSFVHGITDYDSLNYHLTHAARFVEEGAVTGLHPVMADPFHAFHPMGQSLLAAVTMSVTRSDAAVSGFHLGWLGLLLLAAWSMGRSRGAAWTGVAVAAAVAALPAMATFAGTANTDQPALALCVAAAALLWRAGDDPRVALVAGLAGGLALSTKLSAAAPVAVLFAVAVVVGALRGRRLVAAGAGVVLTGAFWYVRNLLEAGSPLPTVDLPGFRRVATPVFDALDDTLLDAAADDGVGEVLRSLVRAMTPLGLCLIALLVVAAAVVALRRGGVATAVAAAGLAGVAAYAVTPLSGTSEIEGTVPGFFIIVNARYLLPAVALCGLAVVAAVGERARLLTAGLSAAAVVGVALAALRPAGGDLARLFASMLGVDAGLAALAAAAVAGVLATRGWSVRLPRPKPMVAAAVVAVVGTVGVAAAVAAHDAVRFDRPSRALGLTGDGPILSALDAPRPLTVAAIGLADLYPLAGPRFENDVRYVGVGGEWGAFRGAGSCEELRRLVSRAEVVVADVDGIESVLGPSRAVEWLAGAPNLRQVAVEGTRRLYAVEGAVGPQGCPG